MASIVRLSQPIRGAQDWGAETVVRLAGMNATVYDLSRHLREARLLVVREEASPPYGADDEAADWKHVDTRIIELGVERAAHEREVCRWLVEADRLGVPGRLGLASLREYAERRLGLRGRQTEERLRVGKVLGDLPAHDEALSTGKLSWSAVRELTRVAVANTERAWRDWAVGKTVREVEKQVAARQPGDLPNDRPDPSRIKHRLSFEVRAETIAMFREFQAAVRAEHGGDVDDDMVLHEMVRRATGGEHDGGRAPYQVAVTRCDRCREVAIDAAGESFAVDAVVENMIACDAQHVGDVDGRPHMREAAGEAAGEALGERAGAGKRASQTIPPATRRGVLRRERVCCGVPGCRNHRYLHVHHVKPRSEGGGHDPRLLIPLCHRHHGAVHAGTLVIHGDADVWFSFRHADGVDYGKPPDVEAVDIAKRAFDTLRNLGFKMTRAQELIDTVQRAGAPDTLEAFVQAALRAT